MEKGKGQGRSCLARRLLVGGTVLKVLGLPGGFDFGQLFTVGSRQYSPLWFLLPRYLFFFIVPRDFLGNLLPCCKQSNQNSTLSLFFLSSRAGSTPAACVA